jgi:hypothetical protein
VTKNIPKTIREEIIPSIKKKISPHKKRECVMWVMDGDRGIGKTSSAYQVQRELDPKFDIFNQTSYEYEQILQREMFDIPVGKGHHIDEIRFERMDARTSKGVGIKKVVKEIRPWQHFITLTTPDAHDVMDVFLRYADYYSFFTAEGTMILLKKNPKIIRGNKFGLDVSNFHKINNDRTFKKYFIKPALKARTVIGEFKFPQYTRLFTKKDYNEYHKMRKEMTRKLGEIGKKTKQEIILERKIDRIQLRLDQAFRYSMINLDLTIKNRMEMFGINRTSEYKWRSKLEQF